MSFFVQNSGAIKPENQPDPTRSLWVRLGWVWTAYGLGMGLKLSNPNNMSWVVDLPLTGPMYTPTCERLSLERPYPLFVPQ